MTVLELLILLIAVVGALRILAQKGGNRALSRAVGRMDQSIRARHRRRMAERTHVRQERDGFDAAAFRALRRRMQAAERAELLRLAEAGKIGGDVMRHV